jgi:C4-dicarboxylate-specific signal transduction histidine kinase
MEKHSATHTLDLQFFGAVGASISHEMKNVLAILNESAGLLGDFSRMAATGRPLDPERLQAMAGRMQAQVARGDGIMRALNRFSHSVDRIEETLDLADAAAFVAELARRRAAMKEVSLEAPAAAAPLRVTANAFALQHLLWAGLERALTQASRGAALNLKAEAGPSGPRVRITGLPPAAAEGDEPFPNDREYALAERLGAELAIDRGAGELILSFPGHSASTTAA